MIAFVYTVYRGVIYPLIYLPISFSFELHMWYVVGQDVTYCMWLCVWSSGGHAVGAGAGRRLGHSFEWLYERERVSAVSAFWLSSGW